MGSKIKPIDFHYESSPDITKAVKGKTVEKFEVPDDGMDDWLIFYFTDGTSLHFRYDWIYEWYVKNG